MVTAVAKRDPIVVKIKVRCQDYPAVSNCPFCGGEVEKKLIDFPRNVAYEEGWVTILLVGLPTVVCKGECPKLEWVLEKITRGLDGTVGRALSAIVEGRDLKTAHLNTSAGILIGTETPVLCKVCSYGYALPSKGSLDNPESFKCLHCEEEFSV